MNHVVITGGTKGIGYGLAKYFLEEGCKVTICGRKQATLNNAVDRLSKETKNYNIQGVICDVIDYKSVQNLWDEAYDIFGEVNIWINNAGVGQSSINLWDFSENLVNEIIDINIKGTIYGSMIATKNMLKQNHGYIYNMEGFGSDGSIRNKISLYGTTKRAVRYYTKSLAKELKDTEVKIGTLSPGMVFTDLLENGIPEDNEESLKTRKIFAILGDDVDTVTKYLVEEILKNEKNNRNIKWLTKDKIILRFLSYRSRIKMHNDI